MPGPSVTIKGQTQPLLNRMWNQSPWPSTCLLPGKNTWAASMRAVSFTASQHRQTLPVLLRDLYIAAVSVKRFYRTVSVTGLGLDWNLLRNQCGGRDTGVLAVFWARGSAPITGPVTAQFGGATDPESAAISVHRYRGANSDNPIGSISWANTNGADDEPTCVGGTDGDRYEWSTVDTSGANSLMVVAAHTASYGHTPGAGFIERSEEKTNGEDEQTGLAVQERLIANPTTDVTVAGSFDRNPDWIVVAVELLD